MTYENKIRRGKRKGEMKETHGQEIVSEIKVCPECYVLRTGEKPVKAQVKSPGPRGFEKVRPHRPKDDRPKRKWRNPRKGKGKSTAQAKGKQTDTQPERKRPVVQVVNKLSKLPIVKE
jgi:hypothetical protein